MIKFELCKGYADNKLPVRSTKKSAGYDFFNGPVAVDILPNEVVKITTGVKAYMDSNVVLFIMARSSVAIKRGLVLPNAVAVIDADYVDNPDNEGNIIIALKNISGKTQSIHPFEKFAQGVFVKYCKVAGDNVVTERMGGIGSTGQC